MEKGFTLISQKIFAFSLLSKPTTQYYELQSLLCRTRYFYCCKVFTHLQNINMLFKKLCEQCCKSLHHNMFAQLRQKKIKIGILVQALKIKNSFLVEGYHAKVNLRGVDSLVYSGRLGLIVVDLCYFALFEDFSL